MSLLDEKEEIKFPPIWAELQEDLQGLEKYGRDFVKRYIKNNLEDEKEELVKLFQEDFGDLPDDDPLKFEVSSLLGKLGIVIYKFYDYNENELLFEEALELKKKMNLEDIPIQEFK